MYPRITEAPLTGDEAMKKNEAFPGKHLRADDVPPSFRVQVVVDHVDEETVGSGRDAEKKAVVYFLGKEKGLVLNQTNWAMLEGITGQPDSDEWSGTRCVLFRSTTQYGGKTVPCLRLDPVPLGQQTERQPQQAPPPPPPQDPDDFQVSDSDVPY
jgi:hypothetical protein